MENDFASLHRLISKIKFSDSTTFYKLGQKLDTLLDLPESFKKIHSQTG